MLPLVERTPDRWSPLHSGRTHQSYYTPRPASGESADYWGQKPDPDGQIRDRATESERLQYLSDCGQELQWLGRLQSRSTTRRLRLFDLGAGRGWLLSALSPEQWERYGCETCPVGAAAARAHGEIVQGNWRGRYPDEFFDVVTCHHVIEHLTDPIDHVHEIRRVLRRGGRLLMATPDFASPCAKRFGERYRMLHDATHVSLFTLESMTRMLADFGFTIDDVQFPFPERYATAETMEKWRRGPADGEYSPPWPGNWMTFYARRP